MIPILTIIIPSATRIVSILSILDFFAQSNCYTFLETLGYLETFQICLQFFFYFSTIYRPEQNDFIKPFLLDLYSSGQDTMLKFCTRTNTLKGYRSKKKKNSIWQTLCAFYRPKHDFTFLVSKICKSDNIRFFLKVMYLSCTAEYLFKT